MGHHKIIDPRLVKYHKLEKSSQLRTITSLITISHVTIIKVTTYSRSYRTGFSQLEKNYLSHYTIDTKLLIMCT